MKHWDQQYILSALKHLAICIDNYNDVIKIDDRWWSFYKGCFFVVLLQICRLRSTKNTSYLSYLLFILDWLTDTTGNISISKDNISEFIIVTNILLLINVNDI